MAGVTPTEGKNDILSAMFETVGEYGGSNS